MITVNIYSNMKALINKLRPNLFKLGENAGWWMVALMMQIVKWIINTYPRLACDMIRQGPTKDQDEINWTDRAIRSQRHMIIVINGTRSRPAHSQTFHFDSNSKFTQKISNDTSIMFVWSLSSKLLLTLFIAVNSILVKLLIYYSHLFVIRYLFIDLFLDSFV